MPPSLAGNPFSGCPNSCEEEPSLETTQETQGRGGKEKEQEHVPGGTGEVPPQGGNCVEGSVTAQGLPQAQAGLPVESRLAGLKDEGPEPEVHDGSEDQAQQSAPGGQHQGLDPGPAV